MKEKCKMEYRDIETECSVVQENDVIEFEMAKAG
jgi:hypothetical protein